MATPGKTVNIQVIDPKPKDISVFDPKPKDISVFGETVAYTETRNQAKGNLMGILSLTYPNTFNYTAPRL